MVLFSLYILVVAIIFIYFIADRYFQDILNTNTIIYFFILIIAVSIIYSYFFLKDSKMYKELGQQIQAQEQSYKDIKDLNCKLRSQRHDFMNHLQVIYTLIEMEEHNDTKEYLEKVYSDIGRVNQLIKTSKVAVNALLQAKSYECERREINFVVNINSNLEEIKIEEWELCRCLGNLIDNAMDATLKSNTQKQIVINISEDISQYIIDVINIGEVIPIEKQKKIFGYGYSSKGKEEERGLGLYIVKQVVEQENGSVICNSESNGMKFTIKVPK